MEKNYTCNFAFLSIDSVQEIKSMILSSQSIRPGRLTISPAGVTGLSIKIYCDDRGRIEKACVELMRKLKANIREKIVKDSFIKRFTDRDLEKLRKLERDCDVKIEVCQSIGDIKIKGHITDIPNIQEEIRNILKDIAEKEPKGKILIYISLKNNSKLRMGEKRQLKFYKGDQRREKKYDYDGM